MLIISPDEVPRGQLVPTHPAGVLSADSPAAALLSLFLAGRSPETLRAYRKDLEDFAAFTKAPGAGAAVGYS